VLNKKLITAVLALNLTACGTSWENTRPNRTGLEQILLSTAAERAATKLVANQHYALGKSYINSENFEGYDKAYAIHSIRRYLSDAGVALVDDIDQADTIIELAAGGLSIDNTYTMVGLPAMGVPVPFAGKLDIPEIALYKNDTNRSIAKFSVMFRDAKTGKSNHAALTAFGTAETTTWTVLVLFDFVKNNLALPENYQQLGDY